MKNIYTYKILVFSVFSMLLFASCENDDIPEEEVTVVIPLETGSVDVSKYVSLGASFTAGFTDGAVFIAAQENSFPNIMAQQFATANGGALTQPLMNDNVGGLLLGGTQIASPRLFFNGAGPQTLPGVPSTEVSNILSGPFNNMGVPGAKSFHFVANGYGNVAGVATGQANPYFARMATSSSASMLEDALAQSPTFFTLSEVGGNDVLGYATSGGTGVDQMGNLDPSTYGGNDITDPNVFGSVFSSMTTALTANGAKGVVTNVPNITDLPHFTTVPYNPLDPTDPNFAAQIPTLNSLFGALNGVYAFLESQGVISNAAERSVVFTTDAASAVVMADENLEDISGLITQTLLANPAFPDFLAQFGLPAAAAPQVAGLLGIVYGQSRQATANDLFVLPSSSVIGTTNEDFSIFLQSQGLPAAVAAQFSAEGVTLPLEDKWALTPQEQASIAAATSAYNATISAIAASSDNLALLDLNSILTEASTTGIVFDEYTMTTDLVFGGLVSLDGIHLTARGYALMANKFLETMDAAFGSNFVESGSLAKAGEYPTNYSPTLQ